MYVTKRDGTLQDWDERKLRVAISMAAHDAKQSIMDLSEVITRVEASSKDRCTVEDLHVTVCDVLEEMGYKEVAQEYKAYKLQRDALRLRRLRPDSSAVAEFVHASKYARTINGIREDREATIMRSLKMHMDQRPYDELLGWAFAEVVAGRVVSSMRSMQFAGEAIITNNTRIYNCASTLANRLRVFGEVFFTLLSGSGMGISVQYHDVARLPQVVQVYEDDVFHYTVRDTIEGWADAVNQLIKSFFVTGEHIEFDYSQIRSKGSPLKTSGGRAPGHIPLKIALENLRTILLGAQNRNLRPIEVYDMMCFLAEAVLSGGIRRSSLIITFSAEDGEMVYSKVAPNFVPLGMKGSKNTQRQMSNNSAVCIRGVTTRETFDRIVRVSREWGDPGFFWTNSVAYVPNPCGEIGMNPSIGPWNGDGTIDFEPGVSKTYGCNTGVQFCNLTEVNMAACTTEEEFYNAVKAAAVIGTYQASYNKFEYLGPVTEEIVRREALLGVSLTGMVDAPSLCKPHILRHAAEIVLKTNEEVAEKLGIEPCARGTTIKPSGTASLWLGGVAAGCHAHHARRSFRRIVAGPNEDAARAFAEANPHAVETKPDGNLSLLFCVQAPDNAKVLPELSAMEHMHFIKMITDNWIKPGTRHDTYSPGLTHNVSCTVVVDPGDWDEVLETCWEWRDEVNAMAFLARSGDKGWPYAPREEVVNQVDEAIWDEWCSKYQKVDYSQVREGDIGAACDGERCVF